MPKAAKVNTGEFELLLELVADPHERSRLRVECLEDAYAKVSEGEQGAIERAIADFSCIPRMGRKSALALIASISRAMGR